MSTNDWQKIKFFAKILLLFKNFAKMILNDVK
jgi:hypothetical protein